MEPQMLGFVFLWLLCSGFAFHTSLTKLFKVPEVYNYKIGYYINILCVPLCSLMMFYASHMREYIPQAVSYKFFLPPIIIAAVLVVAVNVGVNVGFKRQEIKAPPRIYWVFIVLIFAQNFGMLIYSNKKALGTFIMLVGFIVCTVVLLRLNRLHAQCGWLINILFLPLHMTMITDSDGISFSRGGIFIALGLILLFNLLTWKWFLHIDAPITIFYWLPVFLVVCMPYLMGIKKLQLLNF